MVIIGGNMTLGFETLESYIFFITEFAILVAVVWEGWVGWKHYKHTLSKYQRYKATKLIKKILK
jgi:hypothetical protein